MTQTTKMSTDHPIKIGKLEVAPFDLAKKMNWHDAIIACTELGKGWHLPTREELRFLYQNKEKIGGFTNSYYWSSTETNDKNAWRHNFSFGMTGFIADKGNEYLARPVRASQ